MRVCRNWRKQSIRRQHDASRWRTGAWHGDAHSRCLVPGMEEIMMMQISGTATMTINRNEWDDLMDAMGVRPNAEYHVMDGVLSASGGMCEMTIGDVVLSDVKPWFVIGRTRGPEGTDRLRKFVRRKGELVEVRTRGRTGYRTLAEAIERAD